MSTGNGESPLARWSRRKLEARTRQDAAQPEPVAAPAAAAEPAAQASAEPAPPTDADMPDIDTLSAESDFSPFMSPGVSDALRNRALRKLFTSAAFNVRDGLDDYDEEYTHFEKLGDIVTSDMKHRVAMEQEKLRQRLAAELDGEPGAEVAESAGTAPAEPVTDEAAGIDEPTEPVRLARRQTPEPTRADD